MKITINDKVYEIEKGTSLKEVLLHIGFVFPCGGNGKCGKCRINCAEIPISPLDERFLSESARAEGWRIACDKKADGEYVVSCPPPAHPQKERELSSCNIAARIGTKEINISIMDDEIAETVTVSNPLYLGNGKTVSVAEYENDKGKYSRLLRAVLGKESIELFEKYGKAQAETFVIATNGYFAKILLAADLNAEIKDFNMEASNDKNRLSLPTETIYFLPGKDTYIGGDVFAETVNFKENTMFVECGDLFRIVYVGTDNNVAAAMWEMTYDEVGLKAVRAAVKTLRPDGYTPFVYLYGKQSTRIESILTEEGLTYTHKKFDMENIAKCCHSLRFRARINKEKERTSILNLLSSENFHRYFSEE